MKYPATMIVPGIAALLERFLRPLAATGGDGVEIRQLANCTIVSAREGRHAATITAAAGGSSEPILVDPAALALADPSQPLKMYLMSDTSAAILRADGGLETVAIRAGTLNPAACGIAETVEGEIASGMTKQVFELDPRHLLAVAQAAVATGAERVTVAVAPRWNALACMLQTSSIAATFVVAGDTIHEHGPPADSEPETDDPLAFTIGDRRRASAGSSRRTRKTHTDWEPEGCPF